MAKRSHHLMTALSKWQLGKLLGRGGLTTGGISWLFALIWSGRPHTIPVSLLCETAKSLSAQAGAGKTSLSWICITTLHVCRKKPQTFQTAKYKKINPKTKQKINPRTTKSWDMEPHGKKKRLSNESTRFGSAARRILFPKAFFALLCPSRLGWGTPSAQRQKGPSGYLMSITAVSIWHRWHRTPQTHRTELTGIPCVRRNHPEQVLTLPGAGTEAALDQGQRCPVKPKNPGRSQGSLTGSSTTEVQSRGWRLPRAPTGMIFWEMSMTSVSKTLHNTLTQVVWTQPHLEVWRVFLHLSNVKSQAFWRLA